jgi:hypothetical protein
VQLLKVGRHFRLSERSKAVLGRDEADCEALAALLGPDDVRLEARDKAGPVGTIRGQVSTEAVRQTAALVLKYAKADPDAEHVVVVRRGASAQGEELSLRPADEATARRAMIAVEGGCGGQTYGK